MKRLTKRQQQQIRRSCEGKFRHESESAAYAHANKLRRQGSRVEKYRCSHCGGWHVGHTPRSVRQSRSDQGEW